MSNWCDTGFGVDAVDPLTLAGRECIFDISKVEPRLTDGGNQALCLTLVESETGARIRETVVFTGTYLRPARELLKACGIKAPTTVNYGVMCELAAQVCEARWLGGGVVVQPASGRWPARARIGQFTPRPRPRRTDEAKPTDSIERVVEASLDLPTVVDPIPAPLMQPGATALDSPVVTPAVFAGRCLEVARTTGVSAATVLRLLAGERVHTNDAARAAVKELAA